MNRLLSFALMFLFVSGCTRLSSHFSYLNAKNKYRDGDYQTAVLSSLEALKIRSNNKRALELFETSSREIFIVFQDYIDNELEKTDPNWDKIISKYKILINVSEKISRCQIPSVRVIYLSLKINPKDYKKERSEVISKAADYHYNRGLNYLASNDRELIKKSALHFKKSLNYIPGYKDSEQKYEDSRKKALKSISISPFDNKVNNDTYSGISTQISDKVETMLFNDSGFIEFINLVDRSKIEDVINEQKLSKSGLVDNQDIDVGMILGINEIVYGSLVRLDVSEVIPLKYSKEINRDVIVRYKKVTDSKGKEKKKPVYGNVKAKVSYHTIKRDASISISCKIVDVETAKIIFTKNYNVDHKHEKSWAIHKSGDQRAHDYKTKKLIKKGPQMEPSENQMVSALIDKVAKKIYTDMSKQLK